MRILNVSFKVISDSILESFALDFKNLAALGAKVSLALLKWEFGVYTTPRVMYSPPDPPTLTSVRSPVSSSITKFFFHLNCLGIIP